MFKITILISISLLLVSCDKLSIESASNFGKNGVFEGALEFEDEFEIPRTSKPPSTPPPPFTLEKGSKIIRNGFMKFEVNRLEKAKSKIDTILQSTTGYYENEQFESYGNRASYSLQLRIPNTKFDSILYVIEKGVGELKSKHVTAEDVTEEYVDLNIRLENNLAYLKQYKEILLKTKSVKEILEVQEKIRRIEEEIESKKGRLKYLDDKVKYSTLNLEITELIAGEISSNPNFGRRIINAFNNGVQGFLSFIIGIVNLWPFVMVGILIFLGRKPIMRKLKNSRWSSRNIHD